MEDLFQKMFIERLTAHIETQVVPLVGVIFDSGGDFGLSLYDDTESISFYKKVALKNNVYKSYLVLKSKIC